MSNESPIPLDSSLGTPGQARSGDAISLKAASDLARTGTPEGIDQLIEWANQQETENARLKKNLRKRELDFSTLFEIVGQTSARSLDLESMQTYLLLTVSGQFTTPRIVIFRKPDEKSKILKATAMRGVRDLDLTLPVDSLLGQAALKEQYCMPFSSFSAELANSPEVLALKEMKITLAVPLIQEVEANEPILEGFLLLGPRLANRDYSTTDMEFLNTLGKMLAICLRNEALHRRSTVDDLTGVKSRGFFDARLSQEINRTMVYQHRSLGLLMLDIDKFKSFNDNYGHQTGDLVLQHMASAIKDAVRNVDLVARYGGEEFGIILLEIDREGVMVVAERVRHAIERMQVTATNGTPLNITASIGAACFPNDAENKTMLIQKADQALYQAKDLGRNRVIMTKTEESKPSSKPEVKTTPTPTPTPTQTALKTDNPPIDRRKPSGRLSPASTSK